MVSDDARNHPPKPPDPHDGGTDGNIQGAGDVPNARCVNPNSKPSYANVVMVQTPAANPRHQYKPRFPAISLPARQVGSKEGRPAISFTGAEIGACEKRFQFSLIAKFTVGRPHIVDIQKELQAAWTLAGRVTISEIWDARHVLIILDSEADVRIALSLHVHKIGHAFFRLFRWYPEYTPKKESKFSTVWVRLTGLPLSLYDSSFVEAIVSTFGYFVAVDDKTKACVAVKYARACIELDVTVLVPDSVWISLPDNNGYWQAIEVETKMSYCSKCRIHGHNVSSCRKTKKATVIPDPNQEPKKNGGNNGPRCTPLDEAIQVSDDIQCNDATNKEKWTEVKTKRNKNKKSAMVFKPKVVDSMMGKDSATSSKEEEAQNSKPKHQAVRGVYNSQNHQSTEEVAREATTHNALAMVPYVGPLQEPTCNKPHAEPTAVSVSCALEYNEATGQYYHPNAAEHFNSIQEKAGSFKVQGDAPNMRYVTLRNKMKLPTGSKQCLSDRA